MDTGPPPPPPFFFVATYSPAPSPSSPISSITILIIILSSVIIVSATVYLLIRFFSRPSFLTTFSSPNNVVSDNNNNEHVHHHVIPITNNQPESLPLFTFSSLTGNISGGDCAVCLSKFNGPDQLRLLPLCCHAFHVSCIDSWLKSNHTCPLCRSTVNPTEADIMNKIAVASGGGDPVNGNRSNSFRIEMGTISRRRDPSESDRRSYSVGSFEYVLDDGYEIPAESTHPTAVSVDKDSPPEPNLESEIAGDGDGCGGGGSGRHNWLRDYVGRVSTSRTLSFRGGSGRLFTESSRRSEAVDDYYEVTHGRIGEEISELFRWLSGV